MKNLGLRLLAIGCILFVTADMFAFSNNYTINSVYLGACGGYSTILGKVSPMQVPGGGMAGIDFGGEIYGNHLLVDYGLYGQMFTSSCSTEISVPDVKGEIYTTHYDMISPLEEKMMYGYLGVKLMLGYSANNFLKNEPGGFYFLAGFNTAFLVGREHTGSLRYQATQMIAGQSMQSKESLTTSHFSINSNVIIMLSTEIGYELNTCKFDRIRFAAFVDYGFNNMFYTQASESCQPNPKDLNEIVLKSYYISPEMSGIGTHPLMAGIKITYLFGTSAHK